MIAKITSAMKSTMEKIHATLMKPEVKKAGTEQIKKKAKTSIIDRLNRHKAEISEREAKQSHREITKKQNMEL